MIDRLDKSFHGKKVLDQISLTIEPEETFAIIGPSGTGKSVLLRHIMGLTEPDTGEVRINGVPLDMSDTEVGYRASMVFQTSALFNSLSVGENVALWLREKQVVDEELIEQIVDEKLNLVGLGGTQRLAISELSGGMKKRVAIARSLAVNPDLLLYDEPTAELDPVTTDELARVIEDLRSRVSMTTVIVTHDLNFALHLADRIAMMSGGKIVEIGTPEAIRSSENPTVRNFIYTTTKGLQGG